MISLRLSSFIVVVCLLAALALLALTAFHAVPVRAGDVDLKRQIASYGQWHQYSKKWQDGS